VGCNSSFLHALNYSQVAGLCAGMLALGLIVDRIGRKWGSVTTALIMFIGETSCRQQMPQAVTMTHTKVANSTINSKINDYYFWCAAGVLLTAADGPSAHTVFAFLTAAQALFGFGCGGEFPVAAASASERAESSDKLRSKRGQTTVLVFAMQARIFLH
jgi:MFS family permease